MFRFHNAFIYNRNTNALYRQYSQYTCSVLPCLATNLHHFDTVIGMTGESIEHSINTSGGWNAKNITNQKAELNWPLPCQCGTVLSRMPLQGPRQTVITRITNNGYEQERSTRHIKLSKWIRLVISVMNGTPPYNFANYISTKYIVGRNNMHAVVNLTNSKRLTSCSFTFTLVVTYSRLLQVSSTDSHYKEERT